MADLVRAGGGVVWRRADDGELEVLLVHRSRYQDWAWPKGKVEPGDADEADTALREVREETGYRCALGPELAATHYVDPQGRPKVVRYWAMHVLDGQFVPNREVDDAAWVPLGDAAERLSHEGDRDVLDAFRLVARP